MILRNEEECHGEGKTQRGGDHWGVEAVGSGVAGGSRGPGDGVSKHTIYAWKAKFGGLDVNEAQRLRQLEDENHRLKKLVADLSLDKEMLKAVISKNGWGS